MGGAPGVQYKKGQMFFRIFFIYNHKKHSHTIFFLAADIWHYYTLQYLCITREQVNEHECVNNRVSV